MKRIQHQARNARESFSLLSLALCLLLLTPAAARASDCPRIISQSPYLTRALKWLGRGECIVGVSRYEREDMALPRTGGILDPDAEAIRALAPDLIVTSNWADAERMARVTPPGARLLRLDGFGSLADVENMLRTLAKASRAKDGAAKIAAFGRAWRQAAQKLAAQNRGKRVLVLSSCGGEPYAFGRKHLVGDIFAQAGFEVVESAEKVRHADVKTLMTETKPEIVVALGSASAESCRMLAPSLDIRVVGLDADHFIHPGPDLLQAYAEMLEAFLVDGKK
ncbi:MAG: ABC transporter substrate-binding protein [Zoogloeaceae bacterium]|jgi:iron complex transport system substrate-binding protein|nr:ABC transporter substrate-binding protein [Zoogloeaceae bacterium]